MGISVLLSNSYKQNHSSLLKNNKNSCCLSFEYWHPLPSVWQTQPQLVVLLRRRVTQRGSDGAADALLLAEGHSGLGDPLLVGILQVYARCSVTCAQVTAPTGRVVAQKTRAAPVRPAQPPAVGHPAVSATVGLLCQTVPS